MDFALRPETETLERELIRWLGSRNREDIYGAFDAAGWRGVTEFGVFEIEMAGGDLVDVAVAFKALARGGLSGPFLECDLAVQASNGDALSLLGDGAVLTSVSPSASGDTLVGWGSVASLIIDQFDGRTLFDRSLPPAHLASGLPHGWVHVDRRSEPDRWRSRRWVLGAALLVGLGEAALEIATDHAKNRHQFGRPLGAFQAIQFSLADCLIALRAAGFAVLDAAWRAGRSPHAISAAAIAWLLAEEAAEHTAIVCHQVFGALGFCSEVGLIQLTGQIDWLRANVGRQMASEELLNLRRLADGVPPSTVFGGDAM